MKVVIYARVSSKEQEREGFSIPAQLNRIREYSQKHGHEIVKEFIDVESAKQSGRTHFDSMIRFIRENNYIEGIICHKVDRLCRNFKDFVTIDDLDVKPLFVEEEFPDNASGKLSFGLKVLLAKHYIDNLSDEVKKGLSQKVEQGEYPGKAPVGYINNKATHTIDVDPDKAEYIRKIFEWYVSGNFSLADIRKKCIEEGFRTRASQKHISKSSIEHILKNTFYTGSFYWNGKLYKGIHTPIISKELYDRVQEVLHNGNGRPRKRNLEQFTFKGLLTCGHCGCSITAEVKKGKYIYYHCTGSRGQCPKPYIREEVIDEKLGELLRNIHIDDERLEWLKEALTMSEREEREYRNKMIKVLYTNYNELQGRIDKMYIDKLNGVISEEFWKSRYEEWSKELETLKTSLDKHKSSDMNYSENGIKIIELANKAYSLYKKQERTEKRKLLEYVLSNCIVTDETISTNYKKPFDLIAENVKNENWLGH